MSNFLYDGFEFKELNSKFQLQNISTIYIGEIGEMRLPLLNNQNNGYTLNTSTPYNINPDFLLEKQIDTNIVTLLKYDGTNDIFKFYKNIDLQNSVIISNSLDPINDKDLVTKSFLQSSIGGLGPGTVTSIGLTTNTNGLSISGSPVITGGNININLSNQLQNFSSLGTGSLNQVLAMNSGNNFIWKNVGTLTSIGLTTPINSGITITNTPIIDSGNINIDLSNNLKELNLLGHGLNGQVLSSSNGSYTWITPASGGNVTGDSTTTVNGLALWNNTIGTSLGNTNFTVDVNGNLDLNYKRIVSVQDPVSDQDLTTKKFTVDLIKSTKSTAILVRGSEVILDNLKIRINPDTEIKLQFATVSDTMDVSLTRIIFFSTGADTNTNYTVNFTITTTYITLPNLVNQVNSNGAYIVSFICDKTNLRFYRLTILNVDVTKSGSGYIQPIVLERLI